MSYFSVMHFSCGSSYSSFLFHSEEETNKQGGGEQERVKDQLNFMIFSVHLIRILEGPAYFLREMFAHLTEGYIQDEMIFRFFRG